MLNSKRLKSDYLQMKDIRIGISIGIIISAVLLEYQQYKMHKSFVKQCETNEEQAREIFQRYKLK